MSSKVLTPQKNKVTVVATCLLFTLTFAMSGYWIIYNPQRPLPDPTLYEGIGANLAAGNGYSFDIKSPYRPELTRTPFLPLLIAGLYKIVGREPQAVLWMNAVLIGLAVVLGYLLAIRLLGDRRAALIGGVIAMLTPQVTGASNNILTEPPAMLQLAVAVWLILDWPKRMKGSFSPFHAAILGLFLASIVLNRSSMTPAVLITGTYIVISNLRGRWRHTLAWVNALLIATMLGAPVLYWSARNASLGLAFSPAPIGMYASRVFDMKRHKEYLLDPGQRVPRVNKLYFLHWRRHYGPEQLMALEAKNKEWFESWYAEHSDRVISSLPHRFLALFSSFRNSIFPPWPIEKDQENREIMRWISRALWSLSFLGLILCWKRRSARWVWLVLVCPLVIVHLATVCHERYVFPLLPLLMPYGGVVPVWGWRRAVCLLGKKR